MPYTIVRKAVHYKRLHGWRALFARAMRVREAPRVLAHMSHADFLGLSIDDQYQVWLHKRTLTKEKLRALSKQAKTLSYRPLISLILPVLNAELLGASVESLRGQVYEEWELIIVDAEAAAKNGGDVRKHIPRDSRITLTSCRGGEAAACNAALALARGEFVGVLHEGDELTPDALFEIVKALSDGRDIDLIYTDEDRKTAEGIRIQPFFKPDWSPDLLLSLDYVTRLAVYRKDLVEQIGGFRETAEGSHELDLALRVSEASDRIGHVSSPAYSRAMPEDSDSAATNHRGSTDHTPQVVEEHLTRKGMRAEVRNGVRSGYYTVRYELRESPHIAIVIPTRDKVDMLRRCIDDVRSKSTYRDFEIIIINNQSVEPETLEYFKEFDGRVVDYPHEFNYSAQMNLGVEHAGCEYVIFLNNDTEIVTPDWIEAMLEHAQRPEVGAVGARLMFPGGRVQHEGVLVGPRDLARNLDLLGYYALGECIRNTTAVTAACMMTKASVYREVGGFDPELAVAYNDVDFCIRVRKKGYLVVYTPHAELVHQEGGTRGNREPRQNAELFAKRYRGFRDPYYNDNFDMEYLYYLKY